LNANRLYEASLRTFNIRLDDDAERDREMGLPEPGRAQEHTL